MKVLVIGSGGREHALVWKLRQSRRVSKLYCAPGNGGICAEAQCLAADPRNLDSLVAVAMGLRPDLTVIGPESPLALGIVDELAGRGLRVFGPSRKAAQLESSKAFAKEFMQRHRIPTAHYAVCASSDDVRQALALFHPPIVVKADGLAAGKGVVIASSREEAGAVAEEMLSGRLLGEAGTRVVIEEFLEGEELSFMVMADGERMASLAVSQDHKRVGEGDTGANTGGMGAYSTASLLEPQMSDWLLAHVARPAIAGMRAEGAQYCGVLYCGLMMTARGPQVLEFNCRFGDPECQAVLMRLESDLLDALEAAVEGNVSEGAFKWSPDASVCVVVASGGYPSAFQTGKRIVGLEEVAKLEEVKVFHAGTTLSGGIYSTAAGRVLGVTARGPDLPAAVERAYGAVDKISFDGMYYRKDIAYRGLQRASSERGKLTN